MPIQALSESLLQIESKYSSKDIDWVKYVHDHYKTIFKTAHMEYLDVNKHYWEFYRLEDFLRSKNYDPNIAWIVFYINQIPSNVEFKNLESILLPDEKVLSGLYTSFMQSRAHTKSCRNA
jgi:hypothetical protein